MHSIIKKMDASKDILVVNANDSKDLDRLIQANISLRMTVEDQHATMCQQVQKLMSERQIIYSLEDQLKQAKQKIQELKNTVKELEQEKDAYADMLKEQQANIDHYIKE